MRAIDWNAPLSEDDLLWLGQRLTPELKDKIAANQAKFADVEDDEDEKTGDEPDDDYDTWKRDDLKSEAEGRDPKIDVTGMTKKAEFIAALRTWDAANPEA